ncbi:pilus assembly protein [Thalassotalea ganghwensis]
MKKYLYGGLLAIVSTITSSEDIELYISDAVTQIGPKPKVLIIFDNSGSMGRPTSVPIYTPGIDYPAVGGDNALQEDFTYFVKGTGVDDTQLPVPDGNNEQNRFITAANNCETARNILAQEGYFTGYIREYHKQSRSWREIPNNNGANLVVLDCYSDIVNENPLNRGLDPSTQQQMPDGYPVSGKGTQQNPIYYGDLSQAQQDDWRGTKVTLYTANYLRWHHGVKNGTINVDINDPQAPSRMKVAKATIKSVINSTPLVDFGLQIFNYNFKNSNVASENENYADGGRIVFGIKEMNDGNRTDLITLINSLTPSTGTPLCESLYETYNYFTGRDVVFGDDDKNPPGGSYSDNQPEADPSITDNAGKVYKSPFRICEDKIYVIYITDGEPSYDKAADSLLSGLTATQYNDDGSTQAVTFNHTPFQYDVTTVTTIGETQYETTETKESYLPALAEFMHKYDIHPGLEGKQSVEIFPVGFSEGADDAEPLLKETGRIGNTDGVYYRANDAGELSKALVGILAKITGRNSSLTSASVAANNFDRTQTLNSLYYAMFEPRNSPRWSGNLKKYKIIGGVQKGINGEPAVDTSTGNFSTTVRSYWTPESVGNDGDQVSEGGVAEMLRNKTNRTIYSDVSSSGALVDMTTLLTDLSSTSFSTQTDLANALGTNDDAQEVTDLLKWAIGKDVDDEDDDDNITENRYSIFGDPLHSKPKVINFGNGDIRIIVGTNAGALHMFRDDVSNEETTGGVLDELWAFMPKEFFGNYNALRTNIAGHSKVYGIDGRITSYIEDQNGNGIVESGDKAWIFFGLRRGGTSYYALDISSTIPTLMWKIDANTPGFENLGQSWSQPNVIYSKLNVSQGTANPVLVFGGGYDINKDSSGVGTDDSVGNAIYMVDAKTGGLLWSAGPENEHTQNTEMKDSIPSSIAALDSTGDGLANRLYFGDTGGNVWRVDMPGDSYNGTNPWTIFKFASVGSENDNLNDRRFFYEPDIVRAYISETYRTEVTDAQGTSQVVHTAQVPYDALILASGDRSNPLGNDTQDALFMFKDPYIVSQSFSDSSTPPTPDTIMHSNSSSDLFDLTTSVFDDASLTDQQRTAKEVELSSKKGWFINFNQALGEKGTASSLTVKGAVLFTSYTPPNNVALVCGVPAGLGKLYVVDLAQARNIYDLNDDGEVSDSDTGTEDRSIELGDPFADTPTLVILPNQSADEGSIIVDKFVRPEKFNLETKRTHRYIQEQQ